MKTIDQIYVFVAMDDGDEGIVSFSAGGMHLPLVGADMNRVGSLKRVAQDISSNTGISIEIIKFSKRESFEVIKPKV